MVDIQHDNRCIYCGHVLRKKLCDDLPQVHTYIWACNDYYREYGPEWVEYHHQPRADVLASTIPGITVPASDHIA